MMSIKKIEISTGTIIRLVLVTLAFWFLYMVLDIISLLIISFIIVSAMEPAIDWLQKKKIPRSIGVAIIYLLALAFLGITVSFLVPPLTDQVQGLSRDIPAYAGQLEEFLAPWQEFLKSSNIQLDARTLLGNVGEGISSFSRNLFSTTVGVFSGLISAVVVLSLAFYMSSREDGIKNFLVSVSPEEHKEYVASITDRVKDSMGKWMLGQISLMLIIAILVWLGLFLSGVPHPLLLGVFAGIMEIIPYVGPIIGAVPGVILGFLVSPTVGFLAILVYVITQQLENHIILPQVMKKAVGLSPITVILVLLIGAKLAGVTGAVLAVPIAAAVSIFISDLRGGKKI